MVLGKGFVKGVSMVSLLTYTPVMIRLSLTVMVTLRCKGFVKWVYGVFLTYSLRLSLRVRVMLSLTVRVRVTYSLQQYVVWQLLCSSA